MIRRGGRGRVDLYGADMCDDERNPGVGQGDL